MRMRKKLFCGLVFLVFLVVPTIEVNAGIPVSDAAALAQRIKLLAQEISKWTLYIQRFKEYSKIFGRLKNNFEYTVQGFLQDEISAIIGDYLETTLKVIESVAYDDAQNLDDWSGIFKDAGTLFTKYQNLPDTSYLTGNSLYANPNIKAIIDARIKQREEHLANLKATITNLQLIRSSETEIAKKFGEYEKQINLMGQDEYPSQAKITALMNLMDLDILKLNTNIMALYRMMLENELKDMASQIQEEQLQSRNAHDEKRNNK